MVRQWRYVAGRAMWEMPTGAALADDLVLGTARPDPTEFIQIAVVPFSDVVAMVLSGEIMDAMTVVAVLLAERRRQTQCRSAKLGGSRGRGGMADALDLGSSEETRGGSSPPAHTL